MKLTNAQLESYWDLGVLVSDGPVFSPSQIETLRGEVPAMLAERGPRRVMEKGRELVRSVYGTHRTNVTYDSLTRDARLVEPAQALIQDEIYVHQFKINVKASFGGDRWEWHQDYIFWQQEDGIPRDQLVNAVVYLDDVSEFNGPLICVPHSHKEGVISCSPGGTPAGYEEDPDWVANLTADIKYSVTHDDVRRLVNRYGLRSLHGPAGTVVFFHPNLVHASAMNMSPFERRAVFVTYNSVHNRPDPNGQRRPDFLCSREFQPVVATRAGD